MMQTLRVIMSEALIESDYVAVFKMLGLFAREKDLALMMALEFKFQEVTVRCLQSCDEQVCTSCSRYISNSLSHLEEVDEVFLNAGLLENISMLHEKQRLKEFKKLKENCTLIMVNLLSSSSQNFTRVIKSPLIGICLQLLTEEQIKPRVSDSSDKPILFNLIDVFRIFYLKADDEHLFNFTKMHSDIIQVVLKCTGIQVDPKQVIMCLIIINKILGIGEKFKSDEFLDYIIENDLGWYLERVQTHADIYVYNFTIKIIEKYFAG